jgi:hypothetical protein
VAIIGSWFSSLFMVLVFAMLDRRAVVADGSSYSGKNANELASMMLERMDE